MGRWTSIAPAAVAVLLCGAPLTAQHHQHEPPAPPPPEETHEGHEMPPPPADTWKAGVGALGSLALIPDELEHEYGDRPISWMVFLRARM